MDTDFPLSLPLSVPKSLSLSLSLPPSLPPPFLSFSPPLSVSPFLCPPPPLSLRASCLDKTTAPEEQSAYSNQRILCSADVMATVILLFL